jgi:hypothetical protein
VSHRTRFASGGTLHVAASKTAPILIETELARQGIHFSRGQQLSVLESSNWRGYEV